VFYWKIEIVAKTLFVWGLLFVTGFLLPQAAFAEMSQAVVTPDTMSVDVRNRYAAFYDATHPLPKGMEDISGFTIAEDFCNLTEKICFPGIISNKGQPFYGFVSLVLHGSQLTFTTRQVDDVHYQFEGKFLHHPPFDDETLQKGKVVLEGILKKYKDGELAVYAPVQFKPFIYGE
jgi:hypothetical protein